MYGGAIVNDIENTVLNGAVWVLSLPSFNWHMQDTTPDLGRWVHTCEAVGRQMISIGGAVVYSDTSSDAFLVTGGVPDPWDQGLGVFDMTTMQWTDGYDAHAKPYTTPQVIKDWYRNNGLFPNWDDAKVRTLFESKSQDHTLSAQFSTHKACFCLQVQPKLASSRRRATATQESAAIPARATPAPSPAEWSEPWSPSLSSPH